MMVTRVISYYLRMFVCGGITLGYHVSLMRRKPDLMREGEEAEHREEPTHSE